MQAGDGDRLYGSVTSRDVAAALEAAGHLVDRRKLVLPEGTLKSLGEHEVVVKLGGEISATVKVVLKRAE